MEQHAAGIILVTPGGSVILQQRDRSGVEQPGKISFFGGGCEEGETVKESAVRELREETGLDVSPDDLELFKEYDVTAHEGRHSGATFFVLRGITPEDITVYEGEGVVMVCSWEDVQGHPGIASVARQVLDDWFNS
ncbi:MAG: NUDIX hydrolase [Candidatus Paceibacterota bacterium]